MDLSKSHDDIIVHAPSIEDIHSSLDALEANRADQREELKRRQIDLSQQLEDTKALLRYACGRDQGGKQFRQIGERYAQEQDLINRSAELVTAFENIKNGKSIGMSSLSIGKESLRQIGDILKLFYDVYVIYNKCVLQNRLYVFYHETDPNKAGNYIRKKGAPAIPGIFINTNISQPKSTVEIEAVIQANDNLRNYVKALRYKYEPISPSIQALLKFVTWAAGIVYIGFVLGDVDQDLFMIPYILLAVAGIGMAFVAAVIKEIRRYSRNNNSSLRLEYADLVNKDKTQTSELDTEAVEVSSKSDEDQKQALEAKLWGHPYLYSGHALFIQSLCTEQPSIHVFEEKRPYFLTARYLGVNKNFMTKILELWKKGKYESAITDWHKVVVRGREKALK